MSSTGSKKRGVKRTRTPGKSPSAKAKDVKKAKGDVEHSFVGIVQHKDGKWRGRYNDITNKRKWVHGFFNTPEEAARARDEAIQREGADGQTLNFGSAATAVAFSTPMNTGYRAPQATPGSAVNALLAEVQADCSNHNCQTLDQLVSTPTTGVMQLVTAVLEQEKRQAAAAENFQLAQSLKERIERLQASHQTVASLTPSHFQKLNFAPTTPAQPLTPRVVMLDTPKQQPTPVVKQAVTPVVRKTVSEVKKVNKKEAATPKRKETPKSAKKSASKDRTNLAPRPKHFGVVASTLDSMSRFCKTTKNYRSTYLPVLKSFDNDSAGEWLETQPNAKSSNKQPRVLAIDCEMVMSVHAPKTSDDNDDSSGYTESESDDNGAVTDSAQFASSKAKSSGAVSTLARVSLVEIILKKKDNATKYEEKVLLDEYVKPPKGSQVVDYLTQVSGITEDNLSKAKLDHDQVRKSLMQFLSSNDILIGHSLQADMNALRIWHDLTVDTSLMFTVKDMPNITCSLKDVVYLMETSQDDSDDDSDSKPTKFQPRGQSHDSCADALHAGKVAMWLVDGELKKNGNKSPKNDSKLQTIPRNLSSLPLRFLKRLTIHNIPACVKEKSLHRLFKDCFPELSKEERKAKLCMKPIKWSSKRTGKKLGSTTVEFDTVEEAKEIFKKIPVNEEDCHPEGFPDTNGNYHKIVQIATKSDGSSKEYVDCDISTYFPVEDLDGEPSKTLHVAAIGAGKVFGKKGARVIKIQKRSGTKIVSKKCTLEELQKMKAPKLVIENNRNIALNIHSDSEAKAMLAFKLLHTALRGDDLGVPDE